MINDKLTIAIVGNSPNLLKYELGNEIDSHDFVVRFNNYELTNYEKQFGKKITHIFLAIIAVQQYNNFKIYKNLDNLLALPKENRLIRDNDNVNFNQVMDYKLNKNDVTFVSHNISIEMRKKINYNKDMSSGLVAIEYFLRTYPTAIIDVYGINFFKDSQMHIFDNLKNYYHETDKEEEYFNKFLKNKVNLHI